MGKASRVSREDDDVFLFGRTDELRNEGVKEKSVREPRSKKKVEINKCNRFFLEGNTIENAMRALPHTRARAGVIH